MASRPIASGTRAVIRDFRLGYARMADAKSMATFVLTVLAFRAAKIWPALFSQFIWTIRLDNGLLLSYAWNRGDIQGIREVFLEECYRIPVKFHPRTLVDLGANIGLATLFYCNTYAIHQVIAVEPSIRNVSLMEKNFQRNFVEATILNSAAAMTEGMVPFVETQASNLGFIGPGGRLVNSVTMKAIIDMIPDKHIDLLKVDIEGYERTLLSGDLTWLDRVTAIIIEVHCDRDAIVSLLESQGFTYFPPKNRNPSAPHLSDFFLRSRSTPA